ncbi:hypothetical protein KUA24_51 [Vibrio phage HNL01]|nr:hypothetical protein KUA24_51 [Vibrio phage HNL01]
MFSKKNIVKKEINGKKYKMKRWATVTTVLEGTKLGKILLPSFSTIADVWMQRGTDDAAFDDFMRESQQVEWLLTSAATQLTTLLTDEHCEELYNKLLSGLSIMVDDEFVEVEDWSDHFDTEEFAEDFLDVLVWSIKENLYDFFMKQAMFRSKIEVLQNLLNNFKQNMPLNVTNED